MIETTVIPSERPSRPWIHAILLVYILLAAAFFRYSGIFWGEYTYMHPDERFLIWVGSDISPVKSLGDYFDTANSSLNPHNRGHGFYVYGTLPMFITRYMVEWVFGHSGFEEMTQVGRVLSALVDLGTVLLVYLAARRLFDRRVGLLAAAFSAAVVLQIQQSHFFTMDTFINFFSFLALYYAVKVLDQMSATDREARETTTLRGWKGLFDLRSPMVHLCLGFGLALGMAVSSKLNAAPMAIALPLALGVGLLGSPEEGRWYQTAKAVFCLILAGLLSLVVFRLFQPYAFSGPGFFGLKPNPLWVANIRELIAQSSGDVDFPPAMQWARRPEWFSLQNLVLWGLGLPLGILAWAGFLWAGWRMLKRWKNGNGEWRHIALIWIWTAFYFTWQSLQRNPTMRYQLPIYPTLVIFAAWAVIRLYDRWRNGKVGAGESAPSGEFDTERSTKSAFSKIFAILVGAGVLLATYAYAFAFSRIYTRPFTRVEASRWLYQNVPGPITLLIQTNDGVMNQPLSMPYQMVITPGLPYTANFQPKRDGTLSQVWLPRVKDESNPSSPGTSRVLSLTIRETSEGPALASAILSGDFTATSDPRGGSYVLDLDTPLQLEAGKNYLLRLELPGESPGALSGEVTLRIAGQQSNEDTPFTLQPVNTPTAMILPNMPYLTEFTSTADGRLIQIHLENSTQESGMVSEATFRATLEDTSQPGFSPQSELLLESSPETNETLFSLTQPITVTLGHTYRLNVSMQPPGGAIHLSGMGIANEGDWDDGLPLRMDGYDGYGGIYPPGLNFNMYWDDNPEKMARFLRILDASDYLVISSNRQWGTLPRIPERFPMTTLYYRNLIGCPDGKDILYCYRTAQPGSYSSDLGYELVKVFESPPKIGPLVLNDQFAEEAFTVYDHPKVFVFKKTAKYDPQKIEAILSQADFSTIIRKPPMRYGPAPASLLLPENRWQQQQQGGTWAELFNEQSILNRSKLIGVIVWYLAISLLGLIIYPLLRMAVPGLNDRGYPLARIIGLLLLAYIVWLAGSFSIPFSRLTIGIALSAILLAGLAAAYSQRNELRVEWRERRKYFLLVESLALVFFIAFLLIRLGNPDLWHPWKGGEKPMDFSYFNAVLKSTTFPPYDPWYAGGYLNYYYYGFVLVGVPVKFLGIVPSFAYNLILPTLASLIALGAFSAAWNLSNPHPQSGDDQSESSFRIKSRLLPAITSSFLMTILGNLGTVRMLFQGYQRLSAPGGVIEGASLITRWVWAVRGFFQALQGANLPISLGDWYWIPSRAIPAPNDVEPITEFPFFTLLYADLHAHLIALPITLAVLGLSIAIILGKSSWKSRLGGLVWLGLAALAIGALRATNTWDFPPYLVLGALAVAYGLWRKMSLAEGSGKSHVYHALIIASGTGALVGLSLLLYQPYAQWYSLGYTKIDYWEGTHTPLRAYLTHWGLFFYMILSWLIWETRDWMAKTPASSLRKLEPYRSGILFGLVMLLLTIFGLLLLKVRIAWFVLPLAVWAGLILLRPKAGDAQRIVLFLVGTVLALTLMVEVIVLVGDIGRMNTVFKFYLQGWTLFSVAAAVAFGWLARDLPLWLTAWRRLWWAGLVILVSGAVLYTMTAGMAKIEDRISEEAPHTLDGMGFMPSSHYIDEWGSMELEQDYQAILWLQQNVEGSPVIVEANLRNLYRWGSRMTIYTGLPGVVGWEWHQQQQRAVVPGSWVSNRIAEIDAFYQTTDLTAALAFLHKYSVRYIIMGQQERGHYQGPGLDKFEDADGLFWKEVFRYKDTVIYEVLTWEGNP